MLFSDFASLVTCQKEFRPWQKIRVCVLQVISLGGQSCMFENSGLQGPCTGFRHLASTLPLFGLTLPSAPPLLNLPFSGCEHLLLFLSSPFIKNYSAGNSVLVQSWSFRDSTEYTHANMSSSTHLLVTGALNVFSPYSMGAKGSREMLKGPPWRIRTS